MDASTITRQQLLYMAGCARGHSNAQIGAATGRTPDGVRSALRRMTAELGLANSPHLVAYGYTTGLLAGLTPEPSIPAIVTPGRLLVLRGLADGLDYVRIARRHYLSPETVRSQAHLLYRSLGIVGTSRAAARAVAIGYQHGHLHTQTAVTSLAAAA